MVLEAIVRERNQLRAGRAHVIHTPDLDRQVIRSRHGPARHIEGETLVHADHLFAVSDLVPVEPDLGPVVDGVEMQPDPAVGGQLAAG